MNLIGNALASALKPWRAQPDHHFHAGENGRPYVCENAYCTSPGLDPRRSED